MPASSWRPAWAAFGEGLNTGFGTRAMGMGDLNGDGYGDLAIGSPAFGNGRGKAYVYCGGPKGPGQKPCWSQVGASQGDSYGDRVGQAGDVNNDGYADLFIAVPSWRQGPGRCEVFYGSAAGLSQAPAWAAAPSGAEREQFGDCTHPTGDVNGDHYDDLLVGAYQALSSAGRALLYLGGPRGLEAEPVWQGRGEAESDQYGYTLSSAGDVDGDGFGDVLVGAKFHDSSLELSRSAKALALGGKAYIYRGGAKGLVGPVWSGLGTEANAQYSVRSYAFGDSNGDGRGELLISAPGAHGGAGCVQVLDAASRRLLSQICGDELGVLDFGRASGPAGDVDGDGFDDLVAAGREGGKGRVWLWRGGPKGLKRLPPLALLGGRDDGAYGAWVAPAGDIDGDGRADVVVSSQLSNESKELGGKVELFFAKDIPTGAARSVSKNAVPRLDVYLPYRARKR